MKTWIDWARVNLSLQEDIPKITSIGSSLPWSHEPAKLAHRLAGDRESLLNIVASLLVSEPTDIHPRFVALTLYAALAGLTTPGFHDELVTACAKESGLDDTEIEMGRSGNFGEYAELIEQYETSARTTERAFYKHLVTLVGILKLEDVPPEWPYIRWEVLNSYTIRDWERALELYNRAEKSKALEPVAAWVLRGQFRYLVFFGNEIEIELDSLEWEPSIYGQENPECALLLLLSGLRRGRSGRPLEQSDLSWLRHAVTDFENAFAADRRPPDWYQAPLARCLGLIGRARDAAVQYESLLYSEIIAGTPALRRLAYGAAASAYHDCGDDRKAINILADFAEDFPSEKGIHLRIAELEAHETNLPAISENLRKERECDPSLEGYWWVSPLIVAGETWTETDRTKVRATPEYEQLCSLLKEYWPPFSLMSQDGRDEWACGEIDWLSLETKPAWNPLRQRRLAKVAEAFARAVELELASRVFETFRKFALSNPTISSLASNLPQGTDGKELAVLAAISLPQSEFERRDPTLGEMAHVVNKCTVRGHPLWVQFHEWVVAKFPKLLAQAENLMPLNRFRRQVAHGHVPDSSPVAIRAICRNIIEALSPPLK